ncbi:hypothetical protein BDV33DRAFT_170765 [Aspergillus novoparasiticus]|uniref:Uncharacterized protein n=1 Tax=Aspergillus novoparasiticus TaxID=986946 RepID=A0A5N6EXV9_9EURO|nr:hypothetical protein BDV33DRAFT_170765 [Aspergillus novoparasiticus]
MRTIIHSALFLAFLSANPVGAVPPLSPPAANSPLNTPLEVLESKVVPGKCFMVARGVSECSTSSAGKRWSVRCHPDFQCTRKWNPCTVHIVTTRAEEVIVNREALCQ